MRIEPQLGPRAFRRRRLLTIGHSYCVDVNRRLADEIARTGEWDVTIAGPARFRGDFAVHTMSSADASAPAGSARVALPAIGGRPVHTMGYGGSLRQLLRQQIGRAHG